MEKFCKLFFLPPLFLVPQTPLLLRPLWFLPLFPLPHAPIRFRTLLQVVCERNIFWSCTRRFFHSSIPRSCRLKFGCRHMLIVGRDHTKSSGLKTFSVEELFSLHLLGLRIRICVDVFVVICTYVCMEILRVDSIWLWLQARHNQPLMETEYGFSPSFSWIDKPWE